MKLYGIKNCDTVIKRPVLEIGDAVHIGFTPAVYEALFTRLAGDR